MKNGNLIKLASVCAFVVMSSCQHRIIATEEGGLGPIKHFYRDNILKLRHDAVELDPRYKSIFAVINDEVEEVLKNDKSRGKLGFVHIVWQTKKRILLEKYGIQWRSPTELNPGTMFD